MKWDIECNNNNDFNIYKIKPKDISPNFTYVKVEFSTWNLPKTAVMDWQYVSAKCVQSYQV